MYPCDRFERIPALLLYCREGGSVAADAKNVTKSCSSKVEEDHILRITKSKSVKRAASGQLVNFGRRMWKKVDAEKCQRRMSSE